MNKHYQKCYRLERKLVNKLKKTCQFVCRTAGSHSPFDVIAIDMDKIYLIQCKSGKLAKTDEKKAIDKMPKLPVTAIISCNIYDGKKMKMMFSW